MMFKLEGVAYPVRYANFQRNSLVPVKADIVSAQRWRRAFAEIDPELTLSPRSIMISGNFVAVQGASELIVYDTAGAFKYMEVTANPSPVVFAETAMALFNHAYQLVYQDYSRKSLAMDESIPQLDEHAYALLVRPLAEEVLAAVQVTGVPGFGGRVFYLYRLVRDSLSVTWVREFPGTVDQALLTKDEKTLVLIRGEEVSLYSTEDGESPATFTTGLARPLTASLTPDDKLIVAGTIEDEPDARKIIKTFSLAGEELWSFTPGDLRVNQPPVTGTDGRLYLIDDIQLKCVINGALEWASILDTGAETWLTITADNSAVVVNGSILLMYDRDGEKTYEKRITKDAETFTTPPALDDLGRIYVTSNKKLYCYE